MNEKMLMLRIHVARILELLRGLFTSSDSNGLAYAVASVFLFLLQLRRMEIVLSRLSS